MPAAPSRTTCPPLRAMAGGASRRVGFQPTTADPVTLTQRNTHHIGGANPALRCALKPPAAFFKRKRPPEILSGFRPPHFVTVSPSIRQTCIPPR